MIVSGDARLCSKNHPQALTCVVLHSDGWTPFNLHGHALVGQC